MVGTSFGPGSRECSYIPAWRPDLTPHGPRSTAEVKPGRVITSPLAGMRWGILPAGFRLTDRDVPRRTSPLHWRRSLLRSKPPNNRLFRCR
jgi:hypothetical protein